MSNVLIKDEDKQTVLDGVSETLAALGLELVEAKIYREYGGDVFEVLIWRAEGVDLNECERAHEAVSAKLDEYDALFCGAYTLKVSSMGLDRPVVTDDDFRRSLGVELELKTDDKTKCHGILKDFTATAVTIEVGGKPKTFERKHLTKVQPYIRF